MPDAVAAPPEIDPAEMEIDRDEIAPILAATAGGRGGNHVLLYGPWGTGKTSTAAESHAPGQSVRSVTLTADQSETVLKGHYIPRGGSFEFQKGPGIAAWEEGGLLIINEIHHASVDVSNLLHVLLDNPAIAHLTLPDGTSVTPQPGFRVIATMNGDPLQLDPAVLDRFSVILPVTRPGAEMLAVLPDDVRAGCLAMYDRDPGGEVEVPYRKFVAFADHRERGYAEPQAAFMATGRLGDATMLLETVQGARFRLASQATVAPDFDSSRRGFGD